MFSRTFLGQISTQALQLLQTGAFIESYSNSCSQRMAPNQIILPNSGVMSSECLPIVPKPAAWAACFWEIIERNLCVFSSHWLSLVGIGTHIILCFSISMQKSRAMASSLGVRELRNLVYGIWDLHFNAPNGNLTPKEIADLQEGKTSVGWYPLVASSNLSIPAMPQVSTKIEQYLLNLFAIYHL